MKQKQYCNKFNRLKKWSTSKKKNLKTKKKIQEDTGNYQKRYPTSKDKGEATMRQ